MPGPTMAEVRALASETVRVTIPKPREDQRLVGELVEEADVMVLRVETDDVAAGPDHTRIQLRERPRDGVVRAYRGGDGDVLVGRVARVDTLDEST